MVNGLILAKETIKLVELGGSNSVRDYLETLDSNFHGYVENKKPEAILGR